MPKAMKRRLLERALQKNGCAPVGGKEHEKWVCSCGEKHSANIPRHKEVSAGVVGDTIKRMKCLPEGWLQ